MPTRSSVHGRENKDVSTAGTLKGDSELTTVGSMSKAKQYYLKQSRYLPGEHRWVLALPVTTAVTSPERVQDALLRPLGSLHASGVILHPQVGQPNFTWVWAV